MTSPESVLVVSPILIASGSVLARALDKLDLQITHYTVWGCWLIAPETRPTRSPARIMIDGESDLSRRWSWRIFKGPIPAGHRIYVKCHDGRCVNPDHLRAYRATRASGEERRIVRPKAKLSWEIVEQMRALENPDAAELAYLHDVHITTIRNILTGKTWMKK